MKKAIVIGLVLILLSLVPGSLTASEVRAQTVPAQPVPVRSCAYGTSGYFTVGAILVVELGSTQSILLKCSESPYQSGGSTFYNHNWEVVDPDSITIVDHEPMTSAPSE
jgi:hypothetical protein